MTSRRSIFKLLAAASACAAMEVCGLRPLAKAEVVLTVPRSEWKPIVFAKMNNGYVCFFTGDHDMVKVRDAVAWTGGVKVVETFHGDCMEAYLVRDNNFKWEEC